MVDKKVKTNKKKKESKTEESKEQKVETCKTVKNGCYCKFFIIIILAFLVAKETKDYWIEYIPQEYQVYFESGDSKNNENDMPFTTNMLQPMANDISVLQNQMNEILNKKESKNIISEEEFIKLNNLVIGVNQKLLDIEKRETEVNKIIESLKLEDKEIKASRADASTVLALLTRVDNLERALEKVATKSDEGTIMLMAVMQLKEAVYRGGNFDVELETVSIIVKNDKKAKEYVSEINKFVDTGVVKKEFLISSFDKYANEMIKHSQKLNEQSLKDKVANKLMKLVNFRRLDVDDSNSVESVVVRVQKYLGNGDIKRAYDELKRMEDIESLKLSKEWQEKAEAFMVVDNAISKLTSMSLAQIKADRL